MKRFAVLMTLLAAACGDDSGARPDAPSGPDATTLPVIDCDVAIVGGGAGGSYTAARLAPTLHENVCLFEKNDALGGRLHDIPQNEGMAGSPVFGAGGMRIMEGQQVLFDLATELGITYQTPALTSDFLNARGTWGFAKEDFVNLYAVTADNGGMPDTETKLYKEVGLQNINYNRATEIAMYQDFRSWIVHKVGGDGLAFLHDMSRFRADFEAPIDARSYMDYLDEEWDVCCTPSYPIGGMQQFPKKLGEKAVADGARVFLSEPVEKIEANGAAYRLTTSKQIVNATKLIIAVPPTGVMKMKGDVIDALKNQPQFQQILPIKVVTIAQWWPTRWWANLQNAGADPGEEPLWRAWSTEHCFNLIEMPLQQYAVDQMVTRSVYDDDRNCVDFWESLYNTGGEAAVNAEIKRGMEYMFGTTVSGDRGAGTVIVPQPIKTHVQIWEDAWHWLRAGTDYTNAQVFDWATAPLGIDKNISLVGEAYNVNRSGWSDAAYKSAIHLLNTRYGMSITLPRTAPMNKFKYPNAPWAARRN